MLRRILKPSWLLALLIAILIPAIAFAQNRPPLPYEDPGACPFECCTYSEWLVNKTTPIHRTRNNNSPVVFTVNPRERVRGVTGVVITTKAGEIRITRPITIKDYSNARGTNTARNIQARPGDIVYLLTSQGEGSYKAWFKGKFIIISAIDVMEANKPGSAGAGSNIPRTTSTWWVQIRNRQGQTGWTDRVQNFDNKDACAVPVDPSI
ncbi:MAG TPA: hypothetical protein V6D28_24395 [Leptolyngbyaceae cyanobacterium]